MRLFGRAKTAEAPQQTIVKLRESQATLEKRVEFLTVKEQHETQEALKWRAKDKNKALFHMKKKKEYEKQRERMSGAVFTIEQQLMSIESSHINLEAMRAMQTGAQTMKKIHGKLGVDDVDKVMDQISEQMDVANEIGDALSQGVGSSSVYDEDDLLNELDELENLAMDEQFQEVDMPTAGSTTLPHAMPTAPTKKPTKQMTEEEDELEKLAALMALQ